MLDKKTLSWVKLGLTIAVTAANLAISIVNGKELDAKIDERAREVFTDMTKGDA